MQVSAAQLNTVRGALVVLIILFLFWGINGVFFPKQFHEIVSKEPFTAGFQAQIMVTGALTLAWVVAAAIALRDPLRNRGLMQAVIAGVVITFIILVYVNAVVAPEPSAMGWVTTALAIILAVVMGVAYPWGQATT